MERPNPVQRDLLLNDCAAPSKSSLGAVSLTPESPQVMYHTPRRWPLEEVKNLQKKILYKLLEKTATMQHIKESFFLPTVS